MAALPPRAAARVRLLRTASNGVRSGGEVAVFDQRLAEIQANLAIENMPMNEAEVAFLRFAFRLNVAPSEERALCRLWNQERAAASVAAVE